MKLELTPLVRGVLVGLIQLMLVGSLAGKLWYDRATLPRVWVRCTGFDPDDPFRGRYVQLRLTVPLPATDRVYGPAQLRVVGAELVAEPAPATNGAWEQVSFAGRVNEMTPIAMLHPPVAVFLPEHVPDPTLHALDEELWLEVTVPQHGPPRPIRLGIKRRGSPITPLTLD